MPNSRDGESARAPCQACWAGALPKSASGSVLLRSGRMMQLQSTTETSKASGLS